MKIVQFGDGKWGQNHKRILTGFDHKLETYDIECKWWSILRRKTIDAVVITTTSENHFPIALMCLERGIPVFVEKPILLKRNQLDELGKHLDNHILMAGHQLVFMPEIFNNKDTCKYMFSCRNGAIPRSEGSLFSLMVHDISVAHYVTGMSDFDCVVAEGNKHEMKVILQKDDVFVDLYARSISNVRLRHTTLIKKNGTRIHLTPDNWSLPDLVSKELSLFCFCVANKTPISVNGITDAYKVMSTVFKIQEKFD